MRTSTLLHPQRECAQPQLGSRVVCALSRPGLVTRRAAVVVRAAEAAGTQHPDDSRTASRPGSSGWGWALSFFMPYKGGVPPDGQLTATKARKPLTDGLPQADDKTLVYVYDVPCNSCSGTGSVRGAARRHGGNRRGGHGSPNHRQSLCKCLVCLGIGYVRCSSTTAPETNGDAGAFTLARKKAAEEAKKQPVAAPQHTQPKPRTQPQHAPAPTPTPAPTPAPQPEPVYAATQQARQPAHHASVSNNIVTAPLHHQQKQAARQAQVVEVNA